MVNTLKKTIAIDGMGGDWAPRSVMGSFSCLSQIVDLSDYHFLIFGDREIIAPLESSIPSRVSYEVRHVDGIVTGDMDVSALRTAKHSSMGLAIQAVKDGEAVAVVSSGNTGIYFALSKILLRTIEGIDRPALAAQIPGRHGSCIFLDLGANAECTLKNLLDFAILGEALARSVYEKQDVKLSLLNIGSEEGKGTPLVKQASKVLRSLFPDYCGFAEGNDICKGEIDVIVTDGFTGNVALKTIEGTARFVTSELKSALKSDFFAMAGALLAHRALKKIKDRLDPRKYNGAIFLGLNGVVVKSHGGSDEVGFAHAVRFTIETLRNNMQERVLEQLEKSKNYGGEI